VELLEDRRLLSTVSLSPPIGYAVGITPFAVAVGDFNGDGKPDLAAVNRVSNTVSVLLGKGDGSFQTATNYNVGTDPFALTVGDFNHDGKLDLATANIEGNTVSVLLGNGDGTFQPAQNFATGLRPASVTVGDFNGDGKPDLAVANSGSGANSVSVLLGNGDGTFQPAQTLAVGLAPTFVGVGDFNLDGKPDLVTANAHGNNISVLLGNGDGTFQPAQNIATGIAPVSVAIGDLNGDGKPDLAVANFGSSTISVLLGNGDGTFQAAQNFAVAGSQPNAVTLADINGDGKLDLAVANQDDFSSSTPFTGNVNVLLGNGDGSFQAAQKFPGGGGVVDVAAGDFNLDGKPDLAAVDIGGNRITVLLNQFATTTTLSGPTGSTYGQSVSYTATVTSDSGPMTNGTVTFLDNKVAISPPLPLNSSGQATFNSATLQAGSHTITASYSGILGGAATTGFGSSAAAVGLTVHPALLSATAVNFTAQAGILFEGTVATFTNADPFGTAGSYAATIDWGDGRFASDGNITGTDTLTVTAGHIYFAPGSYTVTVQIRHILGDTTMATVTATASVLSLSFASSAPDLDHIAEDRVVSAAGTFTDPRTSSTHTTVIDWGDGTTSPANVTEAGGSGSLAAVHTYAQGGYYPITLTLTDNSGGTYTAAASAVVTGAWVQDGVLNVLGTNRDDTVEITRDGGNLQVHASFLKDADRSRFSAAGISQIYVQLLGGNDRARIAADIRIPAILDGGAGNDVLQAGGGPAVLLGGDGNDTLIGGNGRDILIGGNGTDQLRGQGGDDILIGGTTAFDADTFGLMSLLAEWNSTNDYATRLNNLENGTGLTNGYFLQPDSSVFDDGNANVLDGGPGQDLFFAGPLDQVKHPLVNEAVFTL
jgi:hypothetical protein